MTSNDENKQFQKGSTMMVLKQRFLKDGTKTKAPQ